jgi:hypothetical protein
MISRTTRTFRDAYRDLPAPVRRQARQPYRLFLHNFRHPGLRFKQMDAKRNIYSARVGLDHRALGVFDGSEVVWYWIGPHSSYDKRV